MSAADATAGATAAAVFLLVSDLVSAARRLAPFVEAERFVMDGAGAFVERSARLGAGTADSKLKGSVAPARPFTMGLPTRRPTSARRASVLTMSASAFLTRIALTIQKRVTE